MIRKHPLFCEMREGKGGWKLYCQNQLCVLDMPLVGMHINICLREKVELEPHCVCSYNQKSQFLVNREKNMNRAEVKEQHTILTSGCAGPEAAVQPQRGRTQHLGSSSLRMDAGGRGDSGFQF